MKKNIAIQGDLDRGNDIIKYLELLGGENVNCFHGNSTGGYYFIGSGNSIGVTFSKDIDGYEFLTVEDFEQKYIFNVKGPSIIENDLINYFINTPICGAQNLLQIELTLKKDGLGLPYHIKMDEKGATIDDFVKWYTKQNLPKTYAECCKVVNNGHLILTANECTIGYKGTILENFQKLLICRDAYWKLADSWQPDFSNGEIKYAITYYNGKLIKDDCNWYNKVLCFPTEEMRDTFYDNFRELIEECKMLL